ncbi:MAG: hypothetical protein AAF479_12850 [Pseudomonadota bacterium]
MLKGIDGQFAEDGQIRYLMTPPDGKVSEITASIRAFEPGKRLRQVMGIPLILSADHEYRLQPEGDGTRGIQHEVHGGIGLLFWDSDWVQGVYDRVNQALVLARHIAGTSPGLGIIRLFVTFAQRSARFTRAILAHWRNVRVSPADDSCAPAT